MQDKKSQYRGYLITGMVIAFLLVRNTTYINAQEEYPTILSSIQHESEEDEAVPDQSILSKISGHDVPDISEDHSLKDSNGTEDTKNESEDIKSIPPLRLGFGLAGTIIVGRKISYAVIMDETTGKQGMYKLGESINEATVLKIDKESIIVEKNGRTQVLRITGGSYTEATSSEILIGDVLPSIGVSEELPYFEPVFSETGPPVDENVPVEELPHFEPITNNTGPPVDDEDFHEDMPEFMPSVSYMDSPE